MLALALRACKVDHEREYRFDLKRKWRADFRIGDVDRGYLVEIEGGTWVKSRHTTGRGFLEDCEKYNAAALLGWRVLRYTTDQVKSGAAIAQILRAVGRE